MPGGAPETRHATATAAPRRRLTRAMQLREVLGDAARDAPPVEVTALAYDNRLVTPGTLFFCVPGFTRDGHDFAPDAIARGAAALVVQRPLNLDAVPEILVPDVRAAMAPAAARLNGDPTAKLRAVGITGTNGKTTTAFLTRGLLEAAGRRTGLLGTVTAVVGGQERPMVRTTPEAIDLQRTFAEMRDSGDEAVVMEVSSHALELHRADAIHWDVAVFTNLTQDHLDFHPTMEDYFAAKRRLFEANPATAVINVDDPYGRRLADDLPDAVTVAIEAADADLRATNIEGDATGSTFTLDGTALRSPLPGRFNVLNVLCAIAAVRALGVDGDTIANALPHAARVPGRFEPVDEGQPFAVLVDYAHTPDSLDNVLRAARPLTQNRLIVVFGAGGDRDRAKRPLMGAVACEQADVVIVTSDNPRNEDPEAIVAAILEGCRAGVDVEIDRRAAIERAVERAEPGDVVVIAGKGHEQGQELEGGRKIPFDDVTVAREALRARPVA
jgi:UDP-N-acetylmuramoyl-L-alanyl-D-glutamate--2,6-diaminopimelate ligase